MGSLCAAVINGERVEKMFWMCDIKLWLKRCVAGLLCRGRRKCAGEDDDLVQSKMRRYCEDNQ